MTKMSAGSRKELLDRTALRYRHAGRTQKGAILDEFVAATGYARKYAVTMLNQEEGNLPQRQCVLRRRARHYDESVHQALVTVWQAANGICSKRLVPFLPEFVATLERFGHLSLPPEVREKLLRLSVSTVDRLLYQERHPQGSGLSTTRPGKLLKKQIPIRTFADWNEQAPGFMEADLVAHCGDQAAGAFLHTLVLTDIATGWTECIALLRRSEADVIGALGQVRQRLPFPLLGLDTDNGSEFINYELLGYCQREQITFTRSRVHKKNDQAHVEEKNGSIVRRLIGYDRYEGGDAWRALSALYQVLRLYVNHFQPSMKLVSKERHGARVTKCYDKARTPCQRVLVSAALAAETREILRRLHEELDPVVLLSEIERFRTGSGNFAAHVSQIRRTIARFRRRPSHCPHSQR